MKRPHASLRKPRYAGTPVPAHGLAQRARAVMGGAIALGGAAVLMSDLMHALPVLA